MSTRPINDLDRPFAGTNRLAPAELSRIMIGLEEDYAEFTDGATLPCDEEGAPS